MIHQYAGNKDGTGHSILLPDVIISRIVLRKANIVSVRIPLKAYIPDVFTLMEIIVQTVLPSLLYPLLKTVSGWLSRLSKQAGGFC